MSLCYFCQVHKKRRQPGSTLLLACEFHMYLQLYRGVPQFFLEEIKKRSHHAQIGNVKSKVFMFQMPPTVSLFVKHYDRQQTTLPIIRNDVDVIIFCCKRHKPHTSQCLKLGHGQHNSIHITGTQKQRQKVGFLQITNSNQYFNAREERGNSLQLDAMMQGTGTVPLSLLGQRQEGQFMALRSFCTSISPPYMGVLLSENTENGYS